MTSRIKKVAIIGSGIMGSGIACHFANIGVEVLLLDIVPRELNDKEKAKGLTKENVQLENKIDPGIIGGFILKIGDLQFDASVSHQLKSIKETLINTN